MPFRSAARLSLPILASPPEHASLNYIGMGKHEAVQEKVLFFIIHRTPTVRSHHSRVPKKFFSSYFS